jgi:hypothetical protein
MVTQAISGARVRVQEETETFARISTEDRYEGWVRRARLTPAWDMADHFQTSIATLFAEVYPAPDPQSEILTKLVVSTRVAVAHRPEVGDFVPLMLPDRQVGYVHKVSLNITHGGALAGPDLLDEKARRAISVSDLKRQIFAALGEQATRVGRRLIGTPYLWGGCTPFGIDCSGFVQLCYKLSGVQLLRDADIQFTDRRFRRVEEGRSFADAVFDAGDLVVFGHEGKVTHIGMALGDGRFIHSSGAKGVGIDSCTSPAYGETYMGAVRVSPDADLAIEAA